MRPKAVPISARGGPRAQRPGRPSLTRRQPRRRWLDLVLTALMVLAIPAGLVATDPARAGQPSLRVTGAAVPGGVITVSGNAFRPQSTVVMTWDSDGTVIPSARTSPGGTFQVSTTLASSVAVGVHTITAYEERSNWNRSNRMAPVLLATAIVTVIGANQPGVALLASPTAQPSAAAELPLPTSSANPTATPAPAQPTAPPPEPTHDHSSVATPVPAPATTAPAPTPVPPTGATSSAGCGGYPQPRIWLEAQSWWRVTPGMDGTDFGHAHVGTCFPYGVAVSGTVTFDVKITMFENPGTLVRLQPHIATAAGESINFEQPVLNWKAPNGTGELWQRVTIDTTRVPLDGLQELRLFAQIKEPDGKEMHVSTGWQLLIANGRTATNYRDQGLLFTEGRGWYTDVDYTIARFSSLVPTTVSGVWTFQVDLKPGAGGIPVTSHSVSVDPNHHHGDPGWVVKSGSGQYVGAISIDTRQLANGTHRLMLQANAAAPTGSTNSGTLVLFVNVQN